MPEFTLKTGRIVFDPKRTSKQLLELQAKVQETIARDVRQRLADLLFTLRRTRSLRKSQLSKYVSEEMASALAQDNAFDGAQARMRKITRNGKPAYQVSVTRGKNDAERKLTGSLFDLLDQGRKDQNVEGVRVFPVWTPRNRNLKRDSFDVGERVQIDLKQNHSGKLVPVFKRVRNTLKGFEGYGFYKTAVAQSKRQLIGTVVKSSDGSLSYTITERDFEVEFIKGETT